MFLPTNAGAKISTTVRSIHEGRHINLVSETLATKMNEAVELGSSLGWGREQYRAKLMEIISTERAALKSGDRILNKYHQTHATDGGRIMSKEETK